MLILWKGIKVTFAFFALAGLTVISGLLTVLLYDKVSGGSGSEAVEAAVALPSAAAAIRTVHAPSPLQLQPKLPPQAMLDAPIIKQYPELPAGCEVTSLAMLLQYAGVDKTKLELAAEMTKDTTPIRFGDDGAIAYWGNPSMGFVGDVSGKSRGFGIYHTALLPLLQTYVQKAEDLSGKPFEAIERQVASGVPVLVWSTIDYAVPSVWHHWDSPQGPVTATFAEHAVLLVGYDETNVYVNDPITGKKAAAIDKSQFLATWDAMGQQAISYEKK